MKLFHSLKWVSVGSKSTNTKNINKTSNIFVNCTENIEIVQHIGVRLVLNPKTILLKLKFKWIKKIDITCYIFNILLIQIVSYGYLKPSRSIHIP